MKRLCAENEKVVSAISILSDEGEAAEVDAEIAEQESNQQ